MIKIQVPKGDESIIQAMILELPETVLIATETNIIQWNDNHFIMKKLNNEIADNLEKSGAIDILIHR